MMPDRFPIRTALLALAATALAPAASAAASGGEPVGQAANPPQSSDIVVEAPRALPKPRRANRFAGEPEVFATVRVPVRRMRKRKVECWLMTPKANCRVWPEAISGSRSWMKA